MFLFKTSGKTFDSVVKNERHAFLGKPKDWSVGEWVLVSRNRADCRGGEKQIQYVMALQAIERIKPGEAEQFWPGTEGRWRYLVACGKTQKLHFPFDLKEVLESEASVYSPVMTFKRLSAEHEVKVFNFINRQQPGVVS